MLPDRVLNPGPLTYESGALETGYKNKLVSDNVQRTRSVTPPKIFVKLCPFEIFLEKILSAL